MATSKRSKKRPLSLSLSQSAGVESSKIRRKKNISSQDWDASSRTTRSLSMVSEVEDNPKRKFVEEWLENSNPDINIDITNEETVSLENTGDCVQNCDKTDGAVDQVREWTGENMDTKSELVIKEEVDNVVKEKAVMENVVKETVVKEVVEEEVVKCNPPYEEDVESNLQVKEDVREVVESEPGMSSESRTAPAEEEPLLQCPLCWKNFEKSHTQAAHLKACATTHGLTTRQLIDAVDLHKKQMAVRRKLGLFPMVPPPPASKKTAPKKAEGQTSRKGRQSKKSELELALALSLSLAQREEKQQSLNALGFSSKSNGSKKPVPILLTRTQAERERLITEKVSIVLLDESGGTQPSNNSQDVEPSVQVQSAQLLDWCKEDYPLWKKSYFSPSQTDVTAYYVSELGHVIAPSKTEVGANLRHISQLPGRLNTPKKNEKVKEKVLDESSVSECHSTNNASSLSRLEQDVKAKHLSDWASLLKNSSMSDVSIYVRGGRAIPAHKLVLTVRCPLVLRDLTKQENPVTGLHVDVILWPDISNDAALCFLEYVYYGSIRSIHTLRKDMSGLQWLAIRYEANDLTDVLSYFEKRKRAVKTISDEASMRSPTPALSGRESLRSRETEPIVHNVADNGSDEDMFSDVSQKNDRSIHSVKTEVPEQSAQSPDIFSDDYELALSPSPKSRTSRKDIAKGKLSPDPPLNPALTQVENLSPGSRGKPDDFSASSSSRKKSSFGTWNSPQLEISAAGSSRTLKSSSPPKVIDVSPLSDLADGDTGLKEPKTCSQRRFFPADDSDVVMISDDDDSVKDTVPENPKHQDILSMSTESRKSAQSPSADRNSPYISPVWNGFDDMPCDIDMGSNWNDEPLNGLSPIRKNASRNTSPEHRSLLDLSPPHVDIRDILHVGANIKERSPVCANIIEISPVRSNVREISPVRSNVREISPVPGNIIEISPVRSNVREIPPVPGNIIEISPVRSNVREISPVRANMREISPVRANEGEITPVRRTYKKSSSFGAKNVHEVSDSASSEEEVDRGSGGDDLLNDSMNAVLASSLLDRIEKEHQTPKRTVTKEKDGSRTESGTVTPMKNYRGMTTPELKAELKEYGMKPLLGRKKGVKMLEHIYNELHPWVPVGGSFSLSQATTTQRSAQHLSSSQPCSTGTAKVLTQNLIKSGTSSSSSSSGSSAAGLSDVECEDSDSGSVVSQRGTKRLSASELADIVSKHIEKDKVLHRKILEYEPIFIEDLYSDVKSKGYKFKIADLMAYLGGKCINYRSVKVSSRRKKT